MGPITLDRPLREVTDSGHFQHADAGANYIGYTRALARAAVRPPFPGGAGNTGTVMGLKNLLIVIAVAWLASVVWRRWKAASRPARRSARSERMVRCEQCGVYLPVGEALARGDERYACASHPPPRA